MFNFQHNYKVIPNFSGNGLGNFIVLCQVNTVISYSTYQNIVMPMEYFVSEGVSYPFHISSCTRLLNFSNMWCYEEYYMTFLWLMFTETCMVFHCEIQMPMYYIVLRIIYMVHKCPDHHSCVFMKGMDRQPTGLTWSFVTFTVGWGIGNGESWSVHSAI